MQQLRSHAPERERDDTGGHLAYSEFHKKQTPITMFAHETLVALNAFVPSRTFEKRVITHPRHKLPPAMGAARDILAAHFESAHTRKHALDVRHRIEKLVATRLFALQESEAALIAANPLKGKSFFYLSVHIRT